MSVDAEALYRRLGRLIEVFPDLSVYPITQDVHVWLAQASALVEAVGSLTDKVFLDSAVLKLSTQNSEMAVHEIKAIVFRAFAKAELAAPPSVSGAFIPVGNIFDAFAAVSKLLKTAKASVFIVDPYLDASILTDFCVDIPDNINLRLLTGESQLSDSLKVAACKWKDQYGANKPLTVCVAPKGSLHDRLVVVDNGATWSVTQSFKDIASRSPAEIINTTENAKLKIQAYEEVWKASRNLLV